MGQSDTPQVVMTFGTFDLLHPGHLYYLSAARKLGERLITIIARDITVEKIKGKMPRQSEIERLEQVQKCGLADEVLLGSVTDHLAVIGEKKPDILCFGYDQQSFNDERLIVYLAQNGLNPRIITVPSFEPHIHKSSLRSNSTQEH